MQQQPQLRNRTLFAVIHCVNAAQAERNVRVAHDNGCDGVFLINHGRLTVSELLSIASHICSLELDANFRIGLNVLGATPMVATERLFETRCSMLWTDYAHVDVNAAYASDVFEELCGGGDGLSSEAATQTRSLPIIYFGGVAFKGQKSTGDIAKAAGDSAPYMHFVCTSGVATGTAPALDKIEAMSVAARNSGARLAVASGINVDNVDAFLPYVDAFLVASGISDDFHTLNPELVARLEEKIHRFNPPLSNHK